MIFNAEDEDRQTYYLSQQHHVLSSHYEDSSGNVTEFLPHVDALDCLMEN